jgi:hypothetical protein
MQDVFRVQTFTVGLRRAVIGLPFYAAWNLVAYIKEQRGLAAKVRTAVAAVPYIVVATALWAAPWLAVGWLLLAASE